MTMERGNKNEVVAVIGMSFDIVLEWGRSDVERIHHPKKEAESNTKDSLISD